MSVEALNTTIDHYIGKLDTYSFEHILIKPSEESWSIGQVYQHIIIDTNWYLDQVEHALLDKLHTSEPLSGTAFQVLSQHSFGVERIVGDPVAASKVKQPNSKAELVEGLIVLKTRVNNIVVGMNTTMHLGKSKHPGYGYLTSTEWIAYADIHMNHHLTQLSRIEGCFSVGSIRI